MRQWALEKASLTDPDAHNMRFADKAIRPGFNAQIAAVPQKSIIISIEMTDRRNDSGLALPMVEDIKRRYGAASRDLLIDTHYATVKDIAALGAGEGDPVRVFAPPPPERRTLLLAPWSTGEVSALASRTASSNGEHAWKRRRVRISIEDENLSNGSMPISRTTALTFFQSEA